MNRGVLILIIFVFLLIAVPVSIKILSDRVVKLVLEKQEEIFSESSIEENLEKTDKFFDKFSGTNSNKIIWNFDKEWKSSETPPECDDPLILETPVDLNLVTSVLYPGQYRSGDYKPHGGFRFDDLQNNEIDVTAPIDGHLVDGSRYFVNGEIQYTFDVINNCGIKYRFGHLYELTPKFLEIAEKFREPTEGDSRTTSIDPIFIEKGELIATEIGLTNNYFFDWGVYDLRQKNKASEDPEYTKEHPSEQEQYGVCWLDLLNQENSEKVKAFHGEDGENGKQSDYC